MTAITVYGASSPLGLELVERLLSSAKTVCVEESELSKLQEHFSEILSLGVGKIELYNGQSGRIINFTTNNQVSDNCDFSVHPARSLRDNDGEILAASKHCTIVIHDLILSQPNPTWAKNDLHLWAESIINGDDPIIDPSLSQLQFWVSHRDVVAGLSDLLACETVPSGRIDMCGRKAWTSVEIIDEMKMLIQRSQSALTQSFSAKNLEISEIPSSGIGRSPDRPNLAPLHTALLQIHTEGWRTLTPMRISLMEIIASHIE